MANLDNFIEIIYKEMKITNVEYEEYLSLYDDIFSCDRIRKILSTLHLRLTQSFNTMNIRLPTDDNGNYFWAGDSRYLMETISQAEKLQKGLENSEFSFKIDDYYQELINKCNKFLRSCGSRIPPNMEKVVLYYKIPIFKPADIFETEEPNLNVAHNLKLIGEGSYAFVYEYYDRFYQKKFILKRAKPDLNEKEKARFKKEFEEMKKLNSPYVIEVYGYSTEKEEYIMEYMNYSLRNYIEKHNASIEKKERRNIGLQILQAIIYIDTKKLLHRDISPTNILIRKYEDTIVVKIADFGLVKVPSSDLTSMQTEVKGSFNDPDLIRDGFSNYTIQHEIYALTGVLYYVMTGKQNISKIDDSKMKAFIDKGMNADKSKRFKFLHELQTAFKDL